MGKDQGNALGKRSHPETSPEGKSFTTDYTDDTDEDRQENFGVSSPGPFFSHPLGRRGILPRGFQAAGSRFYAIRVIRGQISFPLKRRTIRPSASDADILILLRDSALRFDERIPLYHPTGLGVSVDVFPYTIAEARQGIEERWGVVRIALAEGQTLYAAPGTPALFDAQPAAPK